MDSHPSSHNLAARMARWSGQHRKKAFFGWLAFVILAFAIGNAVGVEADLGRRPVLGRVSRRRGGARSCWAEADLGGRLPPERRADGQGPGVPRRGSGRRAAPAAGSVRGERQVAPRRRRLRLGGRPCRARRFRDRRRFGRSEGSCGCGAGGGGTHAARPSEPRHRAVRIRERQQGHQRDDQRGPEERRAALDPDHADHPHHHLRHPGRGGCAAAHRDHLGDRGDGPHRAAERDPAGGRQPARRDPADRPGRRRRLLALLPEARA